LLLALTRREACRQALLEVTSALPGWQRLEQRPVFVKSFAEAHRVPSGHTVFVIDLGSVSGAVDEVIASIRRLVASRPWLNIVLLAAHLNPDLEAEVIFGLRDLPGLGLMQPSELRDSARWASLLQDQFVERHALMIETDLRGAWPVAPSAFFEDSEIRELLRFGARYRRVGDLVVVWGRERVGVWRRFKRRWGRSPSEMLSLFRVLWAAHLQHEGYASGEIAQLLGFRDVRHFGRQLGARFGLRKSVLNGLGYSEVVTAVAICLAQRVPLTLLLRRAMTVVKQSARA
jgi:hypothetical protein